MSRPSTIRRKLRHCVLAATAVVVVAGLAFAAWTWSRPSRPQLATLAPRDVDVWIEAPDLAHIAAPAARALGLERGSGALVDGVTTALGLPAADVRAAAEGSAACALALRRSSNGMEAALLVAIRDPEIVGRLARGGSWVQDGSFAKGAERWIPKATGDAGARSTGGPASTVAAWMQQSRTLAIGAAPLVAEIARVAGGRAESLATSETYATAAAGAPDGASDMIVIADAKMVVGGAGATTFADGWLARGARATGSIHFGPDGANATVRGRLGGDEVPDLAAFAPAGELTLGARLPRETIAYLAFSTRTGLSGAEAERMLVARTGEADPWLGAALAADLAVVREMHGITLASAYDALGREAVVAVVAAPDAKLAPSPAPELLGRDVALVYVQHVAAGDLGKRLVGALRERATSSALRDTHEVRATDGGFRADPRGAGASVPSIRVELLGDHLIAGLGAARLLERAVSAHARGEATLATDAAHTRALASLPAASHVRAWIDAGRILKALGGAAQRGNEDIDGEARRTTAVSTTLFADAGWTYRVDVHDAFALLPVLRHAIDAPWDEATPPVAAVAPAEPVGVPECDDYLSRLTRCIADLPGQQRAAMQEEARRARDAWRTAAATARPTVVSVCKAAADELPPYCG